MSDTKRLQYAFDTVKYNVGAAHEKPWLVVPTYLSVLIAAVYTGGVIGNGIIPEKSFTLDDTRTEYSDSTIEVLNGQVDQMVDLSESIQKIEDDLFKASFDENGSETIAALEAQKKDTNDRLANATKIFYAAALTNRSLVETDFVDLRQRLVDNNLYTDHVYNRIDLVESRPERFTDCQDKEMTVNSDDRLALASNIEHCMATYGNHSFYNFLTGAAGVGLGFLVTFGLALTVGGRTNDFYNNNNKPKRADYQRKAN